MYLSSALVSDRLSTWIDIMQSSFMPMLKEAVFTTIPLTLITFIIGLILATLTALARISGSRILQWIARIYVSIIRGTPLLVQLFIIFYGLPTLNIDNLSLIVKSTRPEANNSAAWLNPSTPSISAPFFLAISA